MLLCRPFHSSFSVWGSGRGGGDFFLFFPIRERVRVFVCRLETTGEEGEEPLPPSFLPFPLYSTVETPKHKLQAGKRRGRTEHPPLSLSSSSSSSKPCDTLLNARALSSPPFSPCCVAWFSSALAASVPAWRVLLEWRRGS